MTCPISPDHEIIRAAALLREGKLVAFPTETVYGLGANALDARAVARIFQIKGRPSTSPVIVHIASAESARGLVTEWPAAATKLAREFWPGPLTLVLPKRPCIPDVVTAGLPSVGLRVPANTAEHVRKSLGNSVDLILDGGPTQVGIESTVLSLYGGKPLLLRPGMISAEQIEAVIGRIELAGALREGAHASPGMHPKHYSPRTPLVLHVPSTGHGAYLWRTQRADSARSIQMPSDPASYAAALYATLHSLDDEGFDWIAVELPPDEPEWAGIIDRLRRASS